MAVPVRVKWRSGHRTAYALSAMDPVRHSPDEALIVVVNAQRWEFVGGGTALMTWLYRANDPHGPRDGLIALAVGDSVVIDDGALLMCDMGGQLRVFEAEARAAVIAGA